MRVLLVAEQGTNWHALTSELERREHDVTLIEDLEAATAAHLGNPFRLIIVWLRGFGAGELDMCQRLCHSPPGDQVLLLIAREGHPGDARLALDAGAKDFLAEPFDEQALEARLELAERLCAEAAARRSTGELARVQALEEALRQSEIRLTLLRGITMGIGFRIPADEIIRRTVSQISCLFPAVRCAYSTIDEQGRMTVLHSIEPAGMPPLKGFVADLSMAPRYLHALKIGSPVIVEDAYSTTGTAALLPILSAGSTCAMLDVPVQHPKTLAGVLCLNDSSPHAWTPLEIEVLAEAGEQLSVTLIEAHARDELQRTEWSLRAMSSRLEALMDNLETGVLFEDPSGNILRVNPALCTLFGGPSPETLVGQGPEVHMQMVERALADSETYLDRVETIAAARSAVSGEELTLADGRIVVFDYLPLSADHVFVGALWHYREIRAKSGSR